MPRFDLKRPCAHCPFRSDRPGFLGRSANRIAHDLRHDRWFACHETVDYSRGFRGRITDKSQFCAGTRLLVEREDLTSTALQLAERFAAMGWMQPMAALDQDSPVYESLDAFIQAHTDKKAP